MELKHTILQETNYTTEYYHYGEVDRSFGDIYNTYVLHREDGPAYIRKHNYGLCEYGYYKNGLLHREDGPAYVQIDESKIWAQYYDNGIIHRTDGPAVYEKNLQTDKITSKRFFIKGKWYDEFTFCVYATVLNEEQSK